MKEIIIKKKNAEFYCPYFIKKGVLGFRYSKILEEYFINEENIQVNFEKKSIEVKGKANLIFKLNQVEIKELKSFFDEERYRMNEFYKNLVEGREDVNIFLDDNNYILVQPKSYFDGEIKSLSLINDTFKFYISNIIDKKIKNLDYLKFIDFINKKITVDNFSNYEINEKNGVNINISNFINILRGAI